MNIITVTLNPAFDVHCSIANFAPYHENLAEITSRDAGGKGINISRALTSYGTKNLAFVVLGDENGDSFIRALNEENILFDSITVRGRIRENITCHTEGVPETRISFKGFDINEEILHRAYEMLIPRIDSDTVITFTGRVPEGLSMKSVKKFLQGFKEKGARLVIDSRSFSLDDLKELKPWLIKPNQEEISEYLGKDVKSFDEITTAAKELHNEGIENVMISLGADGAMLVCDDGIFVAKPPKIDAISTIGAGDSSIAGFLAAAGKGEDASSCLRYAVTFGSAACLTEGTNPPRDEDISWISHLVEINLI